MLTLPAILAAVSEKSPESVLKARKVKNGEGKKINVLGDRMTFILTGEETGGQYTLIEQNNEPGVGIPMHIHTREDEVFRVIQGEVELEIDGRQIKLQAGDTAFCPRGTPHTWRVIGTERAKVDLSFFPSGMEKMFMELSRLPAGSPDMERVGEICGRYGLRFV